MRGANTRSITLTLTLLAVSVLGLVGCAADLGLDTDEQEVALPPPTNLTVVNVNPNRQDLSWDPSPGASKYIVLRGFSPGTETTYTSCCLSGPPFIANHLNENTQYCWQVKNVNSLGQVSAASNEVCLTTGTTTPITPPTTVTATTISSSRITVDWTSVSGAVKYYVNESVGGGPYSLVASTTATSLPRVSLTAATEYCYTVQAVDGFNNVSAVSSPPACTTTFVDGLEGYWRFEETGATTANDSSGFGRDANLAGGAAMTAANPDPYEPIDNSLGRLDASTAPAVATTPSGIAAYRLTSASPFTIAFWVRIPAAASNVLMIGMRNPGTCGAGTQGWEISQDASGLAFIGEAGSVSFGTSLGVGQWNHVAVSYAGGSGGTMRLYIDGAEAANGPYTASNHLSGAIDFGDVGGCASGGVILDDIQIFSRALSGSEIVTMGTRPPPPSDLNITAIYSARQDLAWTAPATGATKWIIRRGVGPDAVGNETFYTHAPNPPNTFIANHLMPSTQYAWQVITVQNGLISVPSNEVVATTLDGPATPMNVTATAISQTRINVSWDAVPNATKYNLQMSTVGPVGPYTSKGTVLAPATSLQVQSLTANTTYWFEVRAVDATFTTSAWSSPASATTFP